MACPMLEAYSAPPVLCFQASDPPEDSPIFAAWYTAFSILAVWYMACPRTVLSARFTGTPIPAHS
jgi:hypothetical protein